MARLTSFSKSYISQVKNGVQYPSKNLIEFLTQQLNTKADVNYIQAFIKSLRQGTSVRTIEYYRDILLKAKSIAKPYTKPSKIMQYLKSLSGNNGNKHAHYRALRAFFNWLYSPKSGLKLKYYENPMSYVDAPLVPKLILPSLTRDQVHMLIESTNNMREKAIIALFTESGLRISELTNIMLADINWDNKTIRVMGKGSKEALAPFGGMSEKYIKEWLTQHKPAKGNIWGINKGGITSMLKRLRKATGLPCNPHTFRRTFACLLRKAGIDTMTIKDLGRWESIEMVQRYTRSFTFSDSMKFYIAPLS